MANSHDNSPLHVMVVCRGCGEKRRSLVEETSRTYECPRCFSDMRVPSRAEVTRRRTQGDAAQRKPARPASQTSRSEPQEKQSNSQENRPPASRPRVRRVLVVLECPSCNTQFDAVLDANRQAVCPLCELEVTHHEPERPKRKKKPPEIDPSQTAYIEPQIKRRKKKEKGPPSVGKLFFSGVFGFPWHLQTITRWMFLSIGCIALAVLLELMLHLIFGMVGGFALLVMRVFFLPTFVIFIWTASYAAACFMPVVVETAAGNDGAITWPEPLIREWALQLIYMGFVGSLAGVGAYFVGLLFHFAIDFFWLPIWVTFFFLYPFFLLSSLEADSMWVPVTMPILRSLYRLWWGWLLFYAITGVLIIGWLVLALLGLALLPFLSSLITGPILAALILIYARLLGRLAYRMILEG